MGLLTKEAKQMMLHWLLADPLDTTNAPTHPIEIRLMAINGSVETPGTEIIGDAYEPSESEWVAFVPSSHAEYANASDIIFPVLDMDYAVTVLGVEIWDSSPEPIRLAFAEFPQPVVVPEGHPFSIAPSQLKVRIS